MIDTIEADDAWWPPTFTPDGVARTRFAWWTMLVASQSTLDSTAASVARCGASTAPSRRFTSGVCSLAPVRSK